MKFATTRGRVLIRSVRAWVEIGLDEFLFCLLRQAGKALAVRRGPHVDGPTVLVAPPGGGNIGDQALVDSCVDNIPGRLTIIVNRNDSYDSARWARDRVQILVLPDLIYGHGPEHLVAMYRFFEYARRAGAVVVIGADIMDGKYNVVASYRRAGLVWAYSTSACKTRVLGFSWNGQAEAVCRWALRRATNRGAVLMVRDPASQRRALADRIPVVQVADVVFAGSPKSLPDVRVREIRELLAGRPYVLVNASGLVGQGYDQRNDYELLLRTLTDAGLTPVLLPHVIRGSGDDLRELRLINDASDVKGTILISELLRPPDIENLCSGAKFVVAGRMHLAVLALKQGVPPIVVSTQGKVEGLLEMFNLGYCLVEPGDGMGRAMARAVDSLVSLNGATVVDSASLDAVRTLANANFAPESWSSSSRADQAVGR